MKTIKIFNFSELTEESKKKAIENCRFDIADILIQFDLDDLQQTFDKFCRIFDCVGRDYADDKFHAVINDTEVFSDKERAYLCDLSGKYLFRYVNNYIEFWFKKGRYYSKKRSSKVLFETNYCLTGTWTDCCVEKVFWDYYNNWPKYGENFTYKNLVEKIVNSINDKYDEIKNYYYNDNEPIEEFFECNDTYEFYENGTKF